MGLILTPSPLEAATFAPFGFVIQVDGRAGRRVNQDRALRLDGFGVLRHEAPANKPIVSLYAIDASKLPLDIALVERHPLSSQLFVPMQACRALVVVAPSGNDGMPGVDHVRAFLSQPGQAICYHPGTWHAPLFAIDEAAAFTMMMWESGTARDCEEFSLPEPLSVRAV